MKEDKVIKSFVDKLERIGVSVTLRGNYPWIYLYTVNDKKVKGTFLANHGFTAFWYPIKLGQKIKFTDRRRVFKKVRETLNL